MAYVILSFHRAHGLAQGLRGTRSEPQDANQLEDTVRREMNQTSNKKVRARRERKQARSAAHWVANEREWIPPPVLGPSSRGKRRGEITLPPLCSLHITPLPLSDIVSRHRGATVSERQLKQNRTRTRLSTNSPRKLCLSSVTSDRKERGHTSCLH
jgi:hypothetical protein